MGDNEIDDDILSYFANDDKSEEEFDSADELLDVLVSKDTKVEEEDTDHEDDEDTQAEIAALQAKIEALKSKKSPKQKQASKSSHHNEGCSTKQNKENLGGDSSPASKASPALKSESEQSTCKHGKPLALCFFCSATHAVSKPVREPDEVDQRGKSDPPKGTKRTGQSAKEEEVKSEAEQTSKSESDQTSTSRSIYDVLPEYKGKPTTEFSKKRRVAHTLDDSANNTKKGNESMNKSKKARISEEKPVKSSIESSTVAAKNATEKGNSHLFAGVDVNNPVMSSLVFDEKTKGRKLIKISKIESQMKGQDVEGDWVTVGVLAKRITQKQSANGKNFCVWHLSDLGLGTENHVVALFLFGESYKQHWKIQVGRVIALLNASIMKSTDTSSSLAITIDNPRKLMELGDSKHLAGCKGVRKSDSKPCSMYVNRKFGDFCEYHVQAQFKKAKAGRMDLQSGGGAPKKKGKYMNNLKKNISDGVYHYGGKTVTLPQEEKKPRGKDNSATGMAKNDCSALKSVMGIQVRIQAAQEYKEMKLKREQEAKLQKDSTVSSFLRQNKNELLGGSIEKKSTSIGSAGVQKQNELKGAGSKVNQAVTKSSVNKTGVKQKAGLCNLDFFQEPSSSKDAKAKLPSAPVLGRGFKKDNDTLEFTINNNDDFCYDKYIGEDPLDSSENTLEIPNPKKTFDKDKHSATVKSKAQQQAENARKKAVLKVLSKGGIEREDPNTDTAKKKAKSFEKIIEKIPDQSETSSNGGCTSTAAAKRSLLAGVLGRVDMNSEAGKQLLQRKSKNVGAVKLAEAEREEKYFNSLEKKEQMAEKMSSVFEIKVTGVACRECAYLAESQSELCKNSGHTVTKIPNVMKRFFACKSCKVRCVAYNKPLPKKPCTRCGESNYEKVAMAGERKGPLLGAETLLLRGKEQKYLISKY